MCVKISEDRNWEVLLVGGASGSGKTSIGRALSRLYGVDLVRVDDFQVLLEAVTTPESLPAIHYWSTHPDWQKEGVDATVKQLIAVGQLLLPGLAAVIRDHLAEGIPMVLEGDFVLPEILDSFADEKVKAFFLYEPQRDQLLRNYLKREGSLQQNRADVSHAYGEWLAEDCAKRGIPVVRSRPWDTLVERTIACLKIYSEFAFRLE